MRKIHCIDLKEESSFNEVREMVGWVEPPDKEGGTWDVTMVDGYFECKDQATAQIIASIEETKALSILLIKQTGGKMENEQTETPQETTEETSETPEETTETTEEESENESKEESSEEDSETKEE